MQAPGTYGSKSGIANLLWRKPAWLSGDVPFNERSSSTSRSEQGGGESPAESGDDALGWASVRE